MNLTKRKIMRKAIRLFTSKGVKNTSLADIATDAHISKGTLYYHYASKDDLILDIATSHFKVITSEVLKCIKIAGKNESQSTLVKQIVKRIASIGASGRLHMYLICEAITENQVLRNQFRIFYNEWRQTLEDDLVGLCSCTPETATSIAVLLIAIVDGLVVQGLLGTNDIHFEKVSSYLVDNLFSVK